MSRLFSRREGGKPRAPCLPCASPLIYHRGVTAQGKSPRRAANAAGWLLGIFAVTAVLGPLIGDQQPQAAAELSGRARWIAADRSDAEAGAKPMPLFRKEFHLDSPVTQARLYVSGLGQYEFRVNGARVGSSDLTPGWSDYRKTVFYDSYDVTSMLHNGANALGIMLGNGMYRV